MQTTFTGLPKEAVMTLFRRSNDVEVSISPEFDSKPFPRIIRGIRRSRGQFDGDWLSLHSTNRTKADE